MKRWLCLLLSMLLALSAPAAYAQTQGEHWDLTHLYADEAAFEAEIDALRSEVLPALTAYEGTLNTPEQIIAFMKALDGYCYRMYKAYTYAEIATQTDVTDSAAQARLARAANLQWDVEDAIAFYKPEILANSGQFLDELMQMEEMAPYVREIQEIRQNAQYQLPAEQEVLLTPLANQVDGAYSLFNALTAGDLRFPAVTASDGTVYQIDESVYGQLMESNDRQLRKDAFEALHTTYGQMRNTIAQNMNNYVNARVDLARLHNYDSALESALADNRTDIDVYNALIEGMQDHLGTVQKGITLRKEMLGLDAVHPYDTSVSLTDDFAPAYTLEEGKQLVVEGLAILGDEYIADLTSALQGGWIDAYPDENKVSGAFAAFIPGAHPYVLLNYTDNYDSVSTMAHEMGHAMHGYYSDKAQDSYYKANATSGVSEVASTANELLLSDYMIANAESDQEKLFYLTYQMGQIYTTFFHQVALGTFEQRMFEAVERGENLSADLLESMWMDVYSQMFGPDGSVDDCYKYYWSRVPHFYMNFYVYQYALAIAASSAIVDRITAGEEGAVEDYMAFLAAGDSADMQQLMADMGIDITDEHFVEPLMQRYERLVSQVEEILSLESQPAQANLAVDPQVEEMHPVLDSVMRAMIECGCDYQPDSSEYFWTTLAMLAVNWGMDNPLCEVVGEELKVPRQLMQEYAAAAFLDYDDLLPIEEGYTLVRYDAGWDAYFVGLGDVGDSYTQISGCAFNGDGTVQVDVVLGSYEEPELYTMAASLSPNPYADAVNGGTYAYSVNFAVLSKAGSSQRTRTVMLAGEEEEITETRYLSPYGYRLWYDANAVKLVSMAGEGYEEFAPVDPDALMPVSLTIVMTEVPDGEEGELLKQSAADNREGGWAIGEIQEGQLDSGMRYLVCEGTNAGVMVRQYEIKGELGTYCITCVFPEEAVEGYGARLDIMVKTLTEDA